MTRAEGLLSFAGAFWTGLEAGKLIVGGVLGFLLPIGALILVASALSAAVEHWANR